MIYTRLATEEDIPLIQRIANETWPVAFADILTSEQLRYMLDMMYSTSSLLQQMRHKEHIFILSGTEIENPLGFAAFEFNLGGLPVTKIHKAYILPEAQGRGLGKRLFSWIYQESLKKGIYRICLNVNRNNFRALAFYEKSGFEITGQENIPIGRGYLMEDYILEKTLSAEITDEGIN
nr:GNAT family N-acetyltransferase [Cytophagales bacterium]